MAAVIPATVWWQRGAATLQPPTARGCSPKGVGLIVAEALMLLSAIVRVELEGTMKEELMLVKGGVLADEPLLPVINKPTKIRPVEIGVKIPVLDLSGNMVASLLGARRVVVVIASFVILVLRMLFALTRSLIHVALWGGPPALLRRRRPAIALAVIGELPMIVRPAALMNQADVR